MFRFASIEHFGKVAKKKNANEIKKKNEEMIYFWRRNRKNMDELNNNNSSSNDKGQNASRTNDEQKLRNEIVRMKLVFERFIDFCRLFLSLFYFRFYCGSRFVNKEKL